MKRASDFWDRHRPGETRRNLLAFISWLFVAIAAVAGPLVWAWASEFEKDGFPAKFWQQWETIAIGCELFYSVSFFVIYFIAKPSVLTYISVRLRWAVFASLLLGWVLLGVGWHFSISEYHAVGSSLYYLFIAAILFGLVDLIFGYEITASKCSEDERVGFKNALWFSDVPVILGLGAMGLYVVTLTGIGGTTRATEVLQAFVAGSIAFQLLQSIIVFGILFWLGVQDGDTINKGRKDNADVRVQSGNLEGHDADGQGVLHVRPSVGQGKGRPDGAGDGDRGSRDDSLPHGPR